MSVTATIPQDDSLDILGRNGVTVSDDDATDTILIDVDLATSSALAFASTELKFNVDGSTIVINGSNQLVSQLGTMSMNELSDVSYPGSLTDNQVLLFDNITSDFINFTPTISGATSTPGGATPTTSVVTGINTTPQNAAGSTHSHARSSGTSVALDGHTHFINGFESDPNDGSAVKVLASLGALQSGTETVVTSISAPTGSYPNTTHTHDASGFVIDLS